MLSASPTSQNGAAIIVPAVCSVDPAMLSGSSVVVVVVVVVCAGESLDAPVVVYVVWLLVSEQDWSIGHAQKIAASAIAGIVRFFMLSISFPGDREQY
jgi:hypothetical protein